MKQGDLWSRSIYFSLTHQEELEMHNRIQPLNWGQPKLACKEGVLYVG